jgi:hypothetical protein
MEKNCQLCGEPFEGKRSDAKYCSSTCKSKYFELRSKTEGAYHNPNQINGIGGINSLSNSKNSKTSISSNDQNQNESKSHENKTQLRNVDMDALTPFDNLFEDKFTQPLSVREKTELSPLLPEKYILQKIEKPNPIYTLYRKHFDECTKIIDKCYAELVRLNTLLKETENDTGNQFIVIGLAGGGLLANALYIDKSQNWYANAQNLISSIISIGGGYLLGSYIKNEYNENNKISKVEVISLIKSKINQVNNDLNTITKKRSDMSLKGLGIKPNLIETIEVENPEYKKALLAIENKEKENKAKENAANIKSMEETQLNEISGGLQTESKNTSDQQENSTDFDIKDDAIPINKSNPMESDKISSMKRIADMKFQLLNFKGKWHDFFGLPQTNFFCVIHGMSGEGKTNFSIQFAKYLAENFGNVLYVSGEEGFAPTFQQKIKALGADDVSRLYAADVRTGQEILNEIENKFHFIVIDSVNNMGIDTDMMRAIRNKFVKSGIIAICQSTKDGKIRGSYEIVHDSDIAVKVMKGIAVTTKNRFKENHKEFDVFAAYGNPKLSVVKKTGTDDKGEDLIFGNTI